MPHTVHYIPTTCIYSITRSLDFLLPSAILSPISAPLPSGDRLSVLSLCESGFSLLLESLISDITCYLFSLTHFTEHNTL